MINSYKKLCQYEQITQLKKRASHLYMSPSKASLALFFLTVLSLSLNAQDPDTKVEKITLKPPVVVNMKQISDREKEVPYISTGPKFKDEKDALEPTLRIPDSLRSRIKTIQIPDNFNFKNEKESPKPDAMIPAIIDNGLTIPPDVGGGVGPNHLMVTLNSQVRIQDKSGAVLTTVTLNNFWSGVGGSPNVFDPKVVYDPYQNRWIITACANAQTANSAILIGISQTNDPTGVWNLYQVDVDAANTNWFDYPSVGFNKDWVVVAGNMFTNVGNSFVQSRIYVFNKNDMYIGTGVGTATALSNNTIGGTLCPALTYDNTLNTIYLINTWNSPNIAIHTITGAVATPILNTTVAFSSSSLPWNSSLPQNFAPQQSNPNLIANGDTRMQTVVYRNGFLWCTHTIGLPATGAATRSAAQWWQINPLSGTPIQLGRVEDATGVNFYAYPSIAVNANNDVLLGFSTFSATQFASAGYAFRLSSDATNTTRIPFIFKVGLADYFKTFGTGVNRWGDYSTTVIDPNGFDIWTLQEYAETKSGTTSRWGTEWFKITAPSASLYSKDTPNDNGFEPNTTHDPMWVSEDIWNRMSQGAAGGIHENPEYRISAPNYLYVKVRNRGGIVSSGTETLSLYWAKASTGLSWTSPWNGGVYYDPGPNTMLMGSPINTLTIPATPAGGEQILEFAWNAPNPATYATAFGLDKSHFCLLARINNSAGMTFAETSDLYANVENNNKIVWKNINIDDNLTGNLAPQFITIANFTNTSMITKLVFGATQNGRDYFKFGQLRLKIDNAFKNKLLKESNVRISDNDELVVDSQSPIIEGFKLSPNEKYTIGLVFDWLKSTSQKDKESVKVALTQYAIEENKTRIVGGETFVFKRKKRKCWLIEWFKRIFS